MRIKKGKTVVCLWMGMVLAGVAGAGSFTDNGNGTVTDGATGLVWQRRDDNKKRSWTGALAYCEEDVNLAGKIDWRLPNIRELRSIVDYEKYNPAIDATFFPDTDSWYYWSSTSRTDFTGNAWYVDFDDGDVFHHFRSDGYYVRCVRGGQ